MSAYNYYPILIFMAKQTHAHTLRRTCGLDKSFGRRCRRRRSLSFRCPCSVCRRLAIIRHFQPAAVHRRIFTGAHVSCKCVHLMECGASTIRPPSAAPAPHVGVSTQVECECVCVILRVQAQAVIMVVEFNENANTLALNDAVTPPHPYLLTMEVCTTSK